MPASCAPYVPKAQGRLSQGSVLQLVRRTRTSLLRAARTEYRGTPGDSTEDQCLHDAVDAGTRVGAIFKEPTVTPTEVQKELLGLKKTWGSPNGAMRRGWNGITISRDTSALRSRV